MSRRYRNRRIGEFLKELDLTEGRSTGVRKILKAMKTNGSPKPIFDTDYDRSYFLIRLPVHQRAVRPERQVTGEVTGQVAGQVTGQVERLLIACTGELSRTALQEALGLSHRDNFTAAYLKPSLAAGLVEMTIPDKPRSSKQKYRLTDKGRRWLDEHGGAQ